MYYTMLNSLVRIYPLSIANPGYIKHWNNKKKEQIQEHLNNNNKTKDPI